MSEGLTPVPQEIAKAIEGVVVTDMAIVAPGQESTVHVVYVANPLMPSASRRVHDLPWREASPVYSYVSIALGDDTHQDWVVSLNGRIIPFDQRTKFFPRPGDYIVVTPEVLGGAVFRTLAEVAVMAAAVTASVVIPGLGAFAGGALLMGLNGAAWAGIAAGAISVSGNILISALMPMQPSSKAQSPSYAFQGPSSLAQSGTVIPKCYGTFEWGGNIISSFIDIEGQDQYINALVCFGFGPARSIYNIEINGKDISTYQNVAQYVRYGTNDQTAIPSFNRVVNGYPQDVQVTCAGGPVVVPGTGDLTQALQVDIEFPTGVFYITGDGNQVPCTVVYQVMYSVSGENDWQPILQPLSTTDVVIYNSDGTVNTGATPTWGLNWSGCAPGAGILLGADNGPHNPGDTQTGTWAVTTYNPDGSHSTSNMDFTGEWQPINTALNQVIVNTWTNGWINFSDSTTEVVYNRTSVYGLAPNKYDIQVTKYGSNNSSNTIEPGDYDSPHRGQEVWIHSVNEITYQDLSYPNMILVGVRALATNQIAGANINITAYIQAGLRTLDNNLLPAALQAFEEDNPACVAADMMLDPLYGGGQFPGIQPINIERFVDEWVGWAELNDTLVPDGNGNSIRLHVFNGVFDNEDNLWNQLCAVGRMSRAMIVPMGLDYGVTVDQAQTPVQMFTMGNIIQDSYQETWMSLDDRANQVEIQFADSTRYYKSDNPLVFMDPSDIAAGVEVKNVRIDGKGITLPAQAWHFAHYKNQCNKLLLRTGQFKSDVDSIACRPGQLIILQHDVPQWGWGGRTLANSSASSILVDRDDLPWDGATAYNVVCLFPSIQRYSGTVTSVSTDTDSSGLTIGTFVNLSSFDGANRVTRAVINGVDCPILSSSIGQVLVTLPPGFTPATGQSYILYDTDVLETASVSGVALGPNNTMIVSLGTPFTQAPADFSTYFYGVPGSQKLVTVSAIRKASEFRSTIEWIDYDSDCYLISTPTVGETSAQITTNPGVTSLTVTEIFTLQTSGTYADFASFSWKNGPNTAGVGIYGSFAGGSVKMLGRLTGNPTTWQMQVSPDVTWTFTVVGFDVNDNYAAFSTAPTVTFTAEGITANLLQGSTFQNGFAYWNVSPRSGDSLAATLSNDGQATYTVVGSALTSSQVFLTQVIPAGKWSIGTELMLSAYFVTTGAPVGVLVANLVFQNSAGTIIGSAAGTLAMTGAAAGLIRVNTALTAVPSGTAQVVVQVLVNGDSLSLPVGVTLACTHLLLEVGSTGQTAPSTWADIDAKGVVVDTFTGGSSSNSRTQASTLPTATGSLTYTASATSITISWTDLVIKWPDGGYTFIQDGGLPAVTGLTASTEYYAFLYWDVVNAAVVPIAASTAAGTPAYLGTAYDANADAECKEDGRVALTTGGMSITTPASGSSGGTGGGGGGGVGPIGCTARGTILETSIGPMGNEDIAALVIGDIPVWLNTGFSTEKIRRLEWITVPEHYRVEVDGHEPFLCSGSHLLFAEGEACPQWCSTIQEGARVLTVDGYRSVKVLQIDEPIEVLKIELSGPTHLYAVWGVLTHNEKIGPNPS
jgi:predicted phage tail protein